ncbi:MAG: hemolysin III family protein [Polyangia bacterium]
MPPIEKPRLRGVSHQVAFFVTLVLGPWLVLSVQPRFRWSTVVYLVTLAAQFGTSALYHRPTWAPRPRQWLRRCDHATIFLLIAGSGTPIAVALDPRHEVLLLWILWTGAAIGVVRALVWITAPKWLVAAIAVTMGSVCFSFLPAFGRALDATTVRLLVSGGILYICGAVVYAARRPDPWPRTFGYHEIFHAFTIIAAAIDLVAIVRITL